MNFSIVLAILAFFMLNSQNASKKTFGNLSDFSCLFSDDTKSFIDCIGKLTSGNCNGDDKLGALLQIISNPALMAMLQNFTPQNGKQTDNNQQPPKQDTSQTTCEDFFRPIENIADNNVKSKLYALYDNWYIK